MVKKECIGIFNDSFPPILDGVTLTVENYAKFLNLLGHRACVVTPWNPEKFRTDYEVMRYFSLPIYSRHPYRYGYPKLDPFIWRRLRRTPFRLVHSHCPFSSGRLAAYVKRKQNVPMVGTFHSKYRDDLEHSFPNHPWIVDKIMGRIIDFFNQCDEVWIPQAKVEETIREYGYKGPVNVVENGTDYSIGDEGELRKVKNQAKAALKINPEKLALLFVGQHIYEKGIGVIADALALLPEEVDYEMNFVGTGYAAEELSHKIADLGLAGKVHFRGVVSDREALRNYYAASDLFLFPSMYDNAPLVVREAAAMGTPSVLVEGSTSAEVIAENHNGFLAERTPESYAAVIKELNSDRGRIRNAGFSAGKTLIRSWEDIVAEVIDRYESLIRRTK